MLWLPRGGVSDRTLRRSGSSDPLRKGAAAIMDLYLMTEQSGTAGFCCRRCAGLVRMTIHMGREGRWRGKGRMKGRWERREKGGERRRERKGEGECKAKADLTRGWLDIQNAGAHRAALAFPRG